MSLQQFYIPIPKNSGNLLNSPFIYIKWMNHLKDRNMCIIFLINFFVSNLISFKLVRKIARQRSFLRLWRNVIIIDISSLSDYRDRRWDLIFKYVSFNARDRNLLPQITQSHLGIPRSVVANVPNGDISQIEYKLKVDCYVLFRTNIVWNSMNHLNL